MTAYRDMPDAELVRKVLELMGYSVTKYGEGYAIYKDGQIVTGICWTRQIEAWSHAPNPLTDANVTMGLVDEMRVMSTTGEINMRVSHHQSLVWYADPGDNTTFALAISPPENPARAICEVYCTVKEGKE